MQPKGRKRDEFRPYTALPFPSVQLHTQLLSLGAEHPLKPSRSHPICRGRLGDWLLNVLEKALSEDNWLQRSPEGKCVEQEEDIEGG